jgi:4-amino-4-deoxy-L-arabinose transferase-like glycosyltransferase
VTALAVIGAGYVWFRGLRATYGLPAGLIGATVYLLMPETYHLGRVFRADSWMLALVACALGACTLGFQQKRRRWFLFAGGLLGLAMLTKVLAIMPFLGCALFLALRVLPDRCRRERVLDFVTFLALFLSVAVLGFGLVELLAPGALSMILGSQGVEAEEATDWLFVIQRAIGAYVWFAKANLVAILAVPFARLAIPSRKGIGLGLCFVCQLLAASALFVLRGAVFLRYLAYTAVGLSGLFAMGVHHFLASSDEKGQRAAVVVLVVVAVALSLFQLSGYLLLTETGTRTLAAYLAEQTASDDVILTDYAELAFHAQRLSVPQAGGIGRGWTETGLMTGKRLIEAMEQHHVKVVALHVPGGPEPPGHLYYLLDWDVFYRYVQEHYRLEERMMRTGQLFEVYVQSSGE